MSGSSRQSQTGKLFLSPTDIWFWVWNSSNAHELVTVESGAAGGAQLFPCSLPSSPLLELLMKLQRTCRRMEQSRGKEKAAKAQKHHGTISSITASIVEGEVLEHSLSSEDTAEVILLTVFSPFYQWIGYWEVNKLQKNSFFFLIEHRK